MYHGISSNIIKSVSEELFGVFTVSELSYFSKSKSLSSTIEFMTFELKMIYEKTFDFQFAHSTEHAALQLPNQFSNSFNEKQFTLRVIIEFSKTFDTVDHKILITKLEKY